MYWIPKFLKIIIKNNELIIFGIGRWEDTREASFPNPMVLNSIGALEHDHVDAGELLEDRNEDGYGELRPILAFQYVAPWVLDRLRLLVGCHEVLVLRIDVISAADLLEHDLSLLSMPTVDERVRGVRKEQ